MNATIDLVLNVSLSRYYSISDYVQNDMNKYKCMIDCGNSVTSL